MLETFFNYLGRETASRIIRARIFQLAEEGYQHQLNIEFIRSELEIVKIDSEREELMSQLESEAERVAAIHKALLWHEERLTGLDAAPEE